MLLPVLGTLPLTGAAFLVEETAALVVSPLSSTAVTPLGLVTTSPLSSVGLLGRVVEPSLSTALLRSAMMSAGLLVEAALVVAVVFFAFWGSVVAGALVEEVESAAADVVDASVISTVFAKAITDTVQIAVRAITTAIMSDVVFFIK
jgi:hypothetical protein